MIKRIITDEELISAAASVRDAMLCTLPEPEGCAGAFTAQFEEKIRKAKKAAQRKTAWRRFVRGAVAAMLFVLIGFSMLLAFSTETRAAVRIWVRESVGNLTTYSFQKSEVKALPEYELTWIPEGCERVYDESSDTMRLMLYQEGSNETKGFTLGYSLANDDSKLTVESFYGQQTIEIVDVWGMQADFYRACPPDITHVLVWFDEPNGVVFDITSTYDLADILRIANGVRIVE